MNQISCLRRPIAFGISAALCGALLAVLGRPAPAGAETYDPPRGALEGFVRSTPRHVDVAPGIDLVVELEPKDRKLESLAESAMDPASSGHRSTMTGAAFAQRFGRSQAELDGVATWLRAHNAIDVYTSSNRLVVGGYLTLDDARRALGAHFDVFERGQRQFVAPVGPVTIPVSGIRAVRGLVAAFAPRLADVATLPNDFRGAWFAPVKFREGYDAVPGGGANQRIALIEDSSDRFDIADVAPFMTGTGAGLDMLYGEQVSNRGGPGQAPALASASFGSAFGASASRVTENMIVQPVPDQGCGREDRGQEADMDVDAALTMAPMATVDLRYDRICVRGGEGLIALQRALDAQQPPDIIVFPFNLGPVHGPTAGVWGLTPMAYLEAAVRGIPIIVPAGDDGSLGYRTAGDSAPGLAYPCVLPLVICVGGSQLGLRNGAWDEGPWNDGVHATGGGISWDPRPGWQNAPSGFEFSRSFAAANHRMLPDVAADASGHLEIFWKGYGLGGVGGTSESAAIVGAQIATINSAVPKEHRITGPGDLYALAAAHPEAFRRINADNDRGYYDNTLRPKPLPPPLGFHGVLPSPAPNVLGCGPDVQANGCSVRGTDGYNPVTGIGSIKEKAAIDALR